MRTPIDAVFEGMGFDEMGRWHSGSFMDFWRWAFADLRDDKTRSAIVELMAKIMVGAELFTMTAQELQILHMSSYVEASGRILDDPARSCDS